MIKKGRLSTNCVYQVLFLACHNELDSEFLQNRQALGALCYMLLARPVKGREDANANGAVFHVQRASSRCPGLSCILGLGLSRMATMVLTDLPASLSWRKRGANEERSLL